MKKLTAIVLALVMIFSLCISSYADSAKDEAEDTFYFVISDSLGLRVDGTPSVNEPEPNRTGCIGSRWVKDSYIDNIYDRYGFTGGYCDGHTGWRIHEAICSLDDTWVVDDYSRDFYPMWAGGNIDTVISERSKNIENLKKADLITVHIGSNNILGTLVYDTTMQLEKLSAYTPYKQYVLNAIAEAKKSASPEEMLYSLLETAEKIGKTTVIAESLVADLSKATMEYGKLWDRLLGLIRQYNPTAKIAVIGLYNSIDTFLMVNKGMNKTVGELAKAITEPYLQSFNTYTHYLSRYAKEYTFIDVSKVDHFEGSNDGAHMGLLGHAQLTELMCSAIGDTFTPPCRHTHTHLEKAKAATWYSLGFSGNLVCSDCGKTISSGHVLCFGKS